MLAAPLASAAPTNELQPMWDPGNPKHDLNNAQIVDLQDVYNKGDVITVSASGLKPETKYVAGQCEMKAGTVFLFFKLPGCLKDNQKTVWSDTNGEISFEFTLSDQGTNAHGSIPTYSGNEEIIFHTGAGHSDGEIVIVEDHGKGFRGTQVADTAGTFRVNP